MNAQLPDSPGFPADFSDRIALLIQRVGSATQIARMCGFSEGVVRSWRNGNTDPSRARCVTLARTLGISLVWLVAGEGSMLVDPNVTNQGEQRHAAIFSAHPAPGRAATDGAHEEVTEADHLVDTQRLSTAVRLLQSELDLSANGAELADNADMLTELYDLIGPAGTHADAKAIAAFNRRLAQHLQRTRANA